MGLGLVALLVPLLTLVQDVSGPLGPSLPLFFLVPVLIAAAAGGRLAGTVVAFASIGTWDWFFIPPLHKVIIYNGSDIVGLVVFLAVALLTGQLATSWRQEAREALQRAESAEALYDLSRALIGRRDVDTVLEALTARLLATFHLQAAAVILPGEGGTTRTTAVQGDLAASLRVESDRTLQSMVAWTMAHGESSGVEDIGVRFLPLRVGARSVGVLQVIYGARAPSTPDREQLIATFANGAAIALEQARLAEEERAAAQARERDEFKTVLLSSVSHDLRTPLAGIKAAASSLLQQDVEWTEADQMAFAADINAEADRLARFVSNLLDMSRIELGVIEPERDWDSPVDLVNRVVYRLAVPAGRVLVQVDEGVSPVYIDIVQMEQVLTNLLENALKYSPAETPVCVCAEVEGGALHLTVSDRGPGISLAHQQRIFDMFFQGDTGKHGAGMGLAIVRGLAEAHGGRAWVRENVAGGTDFHVRIPAIPDGAGERADG